MAKEEKLFSVQCAMGDADYEDVYRIYLDHERGNEKKIALITCIILCGICILLLVLLKNITFLFYGLGCLIIGVSYFLVPVNKKFLAANQLQFGTNRLLIFYPHALETVELLEGDDAAQMAENAPEDAVTSCSTVSLRAYETARGFAFADGKLTNLFFYVPKRGQSAETLDSLREFAKERCSGGFVQMEAESITGERLPEPETETDSGELTSAVAEQYYGARRLRLHDDSGHRIRMDEDGTDAPEAAADTPENTSDDTSENTPDKMPEKAPVLDIDEAMREILAEEDGEDA